MKRQRARGKVRPLIVVVVVVIVVIFLDPFGSGPVRDRRSEPRLCWFIPDGLRADPEVFDVFRWAQEGRLPNIKRLMDRGAYGFCRPTFPSHTPTNFATLLTGTYPEVHGINDGPMHVEGRPLNIVSVGGFSSAAKLVEPIWVTLERQLDADVMLFCVPGSTPPELERGTTVKGRWGGWGVDFHNVIFEDESGVPESRRHGKGSRLFFFGPPLTRYVHKDAAADSPDLPESFSRVLESVLSAWGASLHAWILDSTDDGEVNYDAMLLRREGESPFCALHEGEWSSWEPVTLDWSPPGTDLNAEVESWLRLKLIRLGSDGRFRVLVLFDQLNPHVTDPGQVAGDLRKALGPMVDFPDNFPPQLVYTPEDRGAFLEVSRMSLEWHRDATEFLLGHFSPDIFISDIYTPNQMLTSRWWMGFVDPASRRYAEVTDAQRKVLQDEVYRMYGLVDEIVGKLLDAAGPETVVAVSSDHGAIPLDRRVRVNNLLAREGLLAFKVDSATESTVIDWEATRAVYLQMCHVYVSPDGLAGDWRRSQGPAYDALRSRVRDLLLSLRDEDGTRPVVRAVGWERAGEELRLLEDRVGDLVIVNRPGYGWSEEITEDLEVFTVPLESGYKQAVCSEEVEGMWTPFIISGPGIRKAHFLGEKPLEAVDQYPTLMRALGVECPGFVQGKVVRTVFTEEGRAPQ